MKREPLGLASRHLHDELGVGQFVSTHAPQGTFTLDESSGRPVVLVGAGVGLTPLVSMLHALVAADAGRPVWFVYGARDGEHHPLRREVQCLVESSSTAHLHVAYSRPTPADVMGRDYQRQGRVDGPLLEKLVTGLDADFYLCGSRSFMAAIQTYLESRGVPSPRIRTESFGPVG